MVEERKCQNCGKGFIPTCHITRQKFCSSACRNRYNTVKGHYGVPVNICPECGDKVEQTEGPGRWRRFCSEQCRVKYHQRKVAEQRERREHPKLICPNCGKEYEPEWAGETRRFCSDACRIEWWREYHKANPSEEEPAKECAMCGTALGNKGRGGKYCSRFCYLLAVDRGHHEEICEWCGELVYRTSGDTWHPVVLYDYQPSRAGECASRFLEGFTGLLHTDGYGAYHCKLPLEITVVGCWTHMRRKFTDTLKSCPMSCGAGPRQSLV